MPADKVFAMKSLPEWDVKSQAHVAIRARKVTYNSVSRIRRSSKAIDAGPEMFPAQYFHPSEQFF